MDKEKMIQRIKLLREDKGLTREKLGEGFSKGYINKLETGNINPTVDKLDLIAARLNVTLDYLVGNDDCKIRKCSVSCTHLFIAAFFSLSYREYAMADKYIAKLYERSDAMNKMELECVYLMDGILSFHSKKYDKAIECLSGISSDNEPVESLSLLFLARSYSHVGNLDKSLSCFTKLLHDHDIADTNLNLIYLDSLYYFAYTLLLAKRYSDAERIAVKYREICIKTNHHERILGVYDILGIVELYNNNYERAAHYFRMEYTGYKTVNDVNGMALAYNHSAEVYLRKDDMDKAIKCYQKSILYFRQTHNNKYIAYNLKSIGDILFKQGKNEEALICANSALDLLNHEDIYEENALTEFIKDISSHL